MLGGSVVIAFIRFGVSLAGTILLYSILSEPRYNKKQTIVRYTVFSLVLMSAACIWYVLDWESCVRIVAFAMFICFSFFAVSMSCDPLFLSVYKLALTFYLLAVFFNRRAGGFDFVFRQKRMGGYCGAYRADWRHCVSAGKICEKINPGIQPLCRIRAGSL